MHWRAYWYIIGHSQGPEYKEFVKTATADNEIQFIEVSDTEVANVVFPNTEPTNLFFGIVKSEPERYTAYGELVLVNIYATGTFLWKCLTSA